MFWIFLQCIYQIREIHVQFSCETAIQEICNKIIYLSIYLSIIVLVATLILKFKFLAPKLIRVSFDHPVVTIGP